MNDTAPVTVIDPNLSIQQLAERASTEFQQRFGRPPRWITAAPGRVNLIGEHTDYNGGFVLPMAIERYVVIAADRNHASPRYQVFSTATGKLQSWPSEAAPRPNKNGHWIHYIWGVLSECRKREMTTGPLDIVVDSSVPVGGGLSSSAALEVATATMVELVTNHALTPIEKAFLCQKAEHDYAGVPCGIMDQFSSVMGRENHLILLDCRSIEATMVPLDGDEVSILIINSNVKHELTGGAYAQRRRQCEEAARRLGVASLRECRPSDLANHAKQLDPILLRRARHVVTEIERTTRAAETIGKRAWPETGALMHASHASLRDDYEVSCHELDLLVNLAEQIGVEGGVHGSRMTGGGFGGCTVSLVRADCVEPVARVVAEQYEAETGIKPTVLVSRPARGAQVVAADKPPT